jgi:DNA-directed RNA polymerase specialized sigma24 family protein
MRHDINEVYANLDTATDDQVANGLRPVVLAAASYWGMRCHLGVDRDLIQDCFLGVVEARPGFRPGVSRATTYIWLIVRRVVTREARARRKADQVRIGLASL